MPDFALTIHFLHLLVVSLYTRSLPKRVFWWALQAASAALMTLLGMWACQWRELKPIAFGGRDRTAASGTATTPAAGETNGGGSDGRGVYEMVGLGKKDEAV